MATTIKNIKIVDSEGNILQENVSLDYNSITINNGSKTLKQGLVGDSSELEAEYLINNDMAQKIITLDEDVSGGSQELGIYSHAEGELTRSIGRASHSEGKETLANGKHSHAEGESTIALGEDSHSEGYGTIAGANGFEIDIDKIDNSSKVYTLLNINNLADRISIRDTYAIVVTKTRNEDSGVIVFLNGGKATQVEDNKVTVDIYVEKKYFYEKDNIASNNKRSPAYLINLSNPDAGSVLLGNYSSAQGYQTCALGEYSHAQGYKTVALGTASRAEGNESVAVDSYTHAEGNKTKANGYASHAEGNEAVAFGSSCHAEGLKSKAEGYGSHAEGGETTAQGNFSHAEGKGTFAKYAAHAEGEETKASQSRAHAEGYLTEASGFAAHAEGQDTLASGNQSHAEGQGTKATQSQAHAEGQNTQANGYQSHAEGQNTIAKGNQSHAEGQGTIANYSSQHVQGKFNLGTEDEKDKVHIVGWGEDENNRKNIHTLSQNGDAWFEGKVQANTGIFPGGISINGVWLTEWKLRELLKLINAT